MKEYDYLIVGAGLFGAVCARELTNAGARVLVIDRRDTIGGNCYTENVDGIAVHKYGPHIFHTNERKLWDYVARKIEIEPVPAFSPVAVSRGQVFNLPFNMNTFARLFGVITPAEARAEIEKQRGEMRGTPKNLEEQAISLVGRDVFERLIKGYTEKQWGRACSELPPEIIKRLPVRFTYNNTYYNDRYIGIPSRGWTQLFEYLLDDVEVRLGEDFTHNRDNYTTLAERIIYTGPIDEYYGYEFGRLDYRSLRFETVRLNGIENAQGTAVVNWTDRDIPYTRSIEHKHFDTTGLRVWPDTIITYEYPCAFTEGAEPFYPINDERNTRLYRHYSELALGDKNVIFAGRLGSYKYADMDDTIADALALCRKLTSKKN